MKNNKERRIVCNRIQTPDGTILVSKYRHDFKRHVDKNGETYILDGGTDYRRVSNNKEPFKDLSVYSDDPFELIREVVYRGTTDNKDNLIWVPISKLSNAHLNGIIIYEEQRGNGDSEHVKYIKQEIEYRKANNIIIDDYNYSTIIENNVV